MEEAFAVLHAIIPRIPPMREKRAAEGPGAASIPKARPAVNNGARGDRHRTPLWQTSGAAILSIAVNRRNTGYPRQML
jgi:hypothetical protein